MRSKVGRTQLFPTIPDIWGFDRSSWPSASESCCSRVALVPGSVRTEGPGEMLEPDLVRRGHSLSLCSVIWVRGNVKTAEATDIADIAPQSLLYITPDPKSGAWLITSLRCSGHNFKLFHERHCHTDTFSLPIENGEFTLNQMICIVNMLKCWEKKQLMWFMTDVFVSQVITVSSFCLDMNSGWGSASMEMSFILGTDVTSHTDPQSWATVLHEHWWNICRRRVVCGFASLKPFFMLLFKDRNGLIHSWCPC